LRGPPGCVEGREPWLLPSLLRAVWANAGCSGFEALGSAGGAGLGSVVF
jgi:hypothetical protein